MKINIERQAQSLADRVRAHRQRRLDSGLKEVRVWVPPHFAERIKDIAENLRAWGSESPPESTLPEGQG